MRRFGKTSLIRATLAAAEHGGSSIRSWPPG
jgi:hypothetical protein